LRIAVRRLFLNFIALPAGMLLGVHGASAQAPGDPLVVHTKAGLLRGAARPGRGAEFLGIPYAQPPVGDLRWRPPQPAQPWTGVRDATKFGAACAQPLLEGAWNRHDVSISQEDCLFLNVITPAWPAAKPLPVMFWIHGGANIGGSASSELYNEGTLPEHGVVLVTVNYRLGVFGFLAHPALTAESSHHASGNYGLMDQILALHWVHDNIAAFGGDPRNITVFGQSAGSTDTGMLMTSPLARGLFQKAIAESGAAFSPPVPPLAGAERLGQDAFTVLNLPNSAEGVAALRKLAAPDILAKLGSLATQWPGYSPDVDGWVIPRSPAETFSAREEAPIPLLIGTTSREFGSSLPLVIVRADIEKTDGDLAPQALALYGVAGDQPAPPDPVYGPPATQWTADQLFHCPITTEALWHTASHHSTFEYELDHPIPGQEAQGALHSADLPYVFGYYPRTSNIGGNFGEVDFHLANQIETYWTNFARTGNPNSAALPDWPALVTAHQSFLRFSLDGSIVVGTSPLRGAQCDLYRKVLARQMNPAH
jgi:para-nitrobenzyl esterase